MAAAHINVENSQPKSQKHCSLSGYNSKMRHLDPSDRVDHKDDGGKYLNGAHRRESSYFTH